VIHPLPFTDWCAPISDAAPAGANLEYDSRFQELERAGAGTREQQYGDTIIVAKPPDWHLMRDLSAELSQETRDLRVAVLAIEAATHFAGFQGLDQALNVLRHWVCELWDSVHPPLDEEDQNDPFVRINALARLCEEHRLPKQLLSLSLAEAPPHMKVTLGDIELARGHQISVSEGTPRLSAAEIEATFLSVNLSDLRQTFAACQRSYQSLVAIIATIEKQTGARNWDGEPLKQRIRDCAEAVKLHLQDRLSAADSAVTQVSATSRLLGDTDSAPVDDWLTQSEVASNRGSDAKTIGSRDQAALVIEQVAEYFEHHEPSSPVPLLLRRARRLINQPFVEILRDMAPDGLPQVHRLTGMTEE